MHKPTPLLVIDSDVSSSGSRFEESHIDETAPERLIRLSTYIDTMQDKQLANDIKIAIESSMKVADELVPDETRKIKSMALDKGT